MLRQFKEVQYDINREANINEHFKRPQRWLKLSKHKDYRRHEHCIHR